MTAVAGGGSGVSEPQDAPVPPEEQGGDPPCWAAQFADEPDLADEEDAAPVRGDDAG